MTTTLTLSNVLQVNSTSFVDELGILLGLSRLPGESSALFLRRLKLASRVNVNQDYVGLLNELTLKLGLSITRSIALISSSPIVITSSIAGIVLTQGVNTQTVPLLSVDIDDAWTWRMLSDVVNDINNGIIANASLLVPDGPTIKIAKQSNILTVIAQPITGQSINLGFSDLVVGSEIFNVDVPTYTLTSSGSLIFDGTIPGNTTITYNRQVWPYSLIASDVSMISLLDPSLSQVSKGPNGTIVYQIREVVQKIMQKDKSYWSR